MGDRDKLQSKPAIYLIGGANGAGKTTFAREFLPNEVKCLRFLNADEIARGISPLAPELGAIKAGRLLLSEIRANIRAKQSFALETRLSGRSYIKLLREARDDGYEILLHYLWLSNARQAVSRVRQRVKLGGHDVPVSDIARRFERSLINLVESYLPLATRWVIWDNRNSLPREIAGSDKETIESLKRKLGL